MSSTNKQKHPVLLPSFKHTFNVVSGFDLKSFTRGKLVEGFGAEPDQWPGLVWLHCEIGSVWQWWSARCCALHMADNHFAPSACHSLKNLNHFHVLAFSMLFSYLPMDCSAAAVSKNPNRKKFFLDTISLHFMLIQFRRRSVLVLIQYFGELYSYSSNGFPYFGLYVWRSE